MGLGERFSGGSGAGLGIAAVLLIAAVALLAGHYRSSASDNQGDAFSSFYSTDEGQTYFKDSIFKFPPFDYGGKTAYGAFVFDDGVKRFVGYLFRFTPQAQKQLQDVYSNPPAGESGSTAALILIQTPQVRGEMEMKKPGGEWMASWKFGRPSAQGPDGSPAVLINP
jgi:hypothetical protein